MVGGLVGGKGGVGWEVRGNKERQAASTAGCGGRGGKQALAGSGSPTRVAMWVATLGRTREHRADGV